MASFLRRSIPAILVFLLNTGLTISGYENLTLAVALWSLMVPAAGFAVWPWIKRIRVGLKPPDAELRKALEARDRWRERFETKQSEVGKLNEVREQQLEKIREVEQGLHRLRPENEQLKLENKNLQVDLDQVSKELGQTKHDKANLRHECERLREQNSELRNQRD